MIKGILLHLKNVKTSLIVILFLLNSSINLFAGIDKYKLLCITSTLEQVVNDVTVGQRINDSTGQLNITNLVIQQSIITQVAILKNSTVTSESSSLLVTKSMAYLLFNVTDSLGAKLFIAIQLSETSSGTLSFHPGFGKEIHISRGTDGCSICQYSIQFGRITTVACTSNSGSGCKHAFYYSTQ